MSDCSISDFGTRYVRETLIVSPGGHRRKDYRTIRSRQLVQSSQVALFEHWEGTGGCGGLQGSVSSGPLTQ